MAQASYHVDLARVAFTICGNLLDPALEFSNKLANLFLSLCRERPVDCKRYYRIWTSLTVLTTHF